MSDILATFKTGALQGSKTWAFATTRLCRVPLGIWALLMNSLLTNCTNASILGQCG